MRSSRIRTIRTTLTATAALALVLVAPLAAPAAVPSPDAGGAEVIDDLPEAAEVDRLDLLTAPGHPAGYFPAQIARREALRLAVVQVEEARPVAAPDLEDVAEALRRHQPGLHALALGERIDHHGRAMGEE